MTKERMKDKKTFKGFDLDKNGCVMGAYPSFNVHSELQKATETMIEKENEYVLRIFTSMNIDPDVLAKQKAEIERLNIENEQLKQELLTYKNAICNKECAEVWGESERAKILLKATLDLFQKQKESHYVLNLLENTVFYDEAECDGYCLFDDIEMFLTNGGAE